MKRIVIFILIIFLSALSFADSFTEAIQDLAVRTACIGKYNMKEAGLSGISKNYYTEEMIDSRLARESGNKTYVNTFYGICFDYAQFAYKYIKENQSYYNSKGMYYNQYWMAGVHENPNQIILQYPGDKNNYTSIQNGVYVKIPANGGTRYIKTHNGVTHHAWIWVERSDGRQFWIDPTWTDTGGYVVYGYVSDDGREIQCRPDKKYCVLYPDTLNKLPLPPEMGQKIAPSKSANSNNPEETIQDAGTEWAEVVAKKVVDTFVRKPFIDVNYNMKHDYLGLMFSGDIPFSTFTENKFSINKMGFGLEMLYLQNTAFVLGVDYIHNMEDGNNLHAGLFGLDFTRRLFNNLAWYIGGGAGLRFDTSEGFGVPKKNSNLVDTGYFAWKADTGFILNLSCIFTKIEVSYNNVIGFSVGAGVGFGLEM